MRTMLVGLAAAGMLLAMAAVADEGKGDRARLQGAWKAVKAEQNGKEQAKADQPTLTFAGDTFTITRKDQVILKGTFTLDATKKPRQIDLAVKKSRGGKDEHPGDLATAGGRAAPRHAPVGEQVSGLSATRSCDPGTSSCPTSRSSPPARATARTTSRLPGPRTAAA
jgi:uncharacterized protein (TIGR03067 family)